MQCTGFCTVTGGARRVSRYPHVSPKLFVVGWPLAPRDLVVAIGLGCTVGQKRRSGPAECHRRGVTRDVEALGGIEHRGGSAPPWETETSYGARR